MNVSSLKRAWAAIVLGSWAICGVCAIALAVIQIWNRTLDDGDLWARARYDAEAFARRLVTEEGGHGTVRSTYCAREDNAWVRGPVFRCRVAMDEPDYERPRVALVLCRPGNGCIYDEAAQRAFRSCSGRP